MNITNQVSRRSSSTPLELQGITLDALIGGSVFGIFCYVFFWLALSFWTGINHQFPGFFITHALIFIAEGITIYLFIRLHKRTPRHYIALKQNFLIACTLLSAIHWGILTAYLAYCCDLTAAQQFMVQLIMPGFAALGGLIFGMVKHVGFWYASLTFLPHLYLSHSVHQANVGFLSFITISLIVFIYCTNRIVQYYYLRIVQNYQHTKSYADSMESLSKTDYLTKLNNRFSFQLDYLSIWNQCMKHQQPISLLYLEMGDLSYVIHQHGHQIGELCLIRLARHLSDQVTEPNILANYESNTFIIGLPNTDATAAQAFSNALINTINATELIKGQPETKLAHLIGVATMTPNREHDPEQLIELAVKAVNNQKYAHINASKHKAASTVEHSMHQTAQSQH